MKITGTPTADFVMKLQSQDVSDFLLGTNASFLHAAHDLVSPHSKGQKLHQKPTKSAKKRFALHFLQS